MTTTTVTITAPRLALPARWQEAWLDWVEERSGLHIRETRLHVLESSLRERMAATGAETHEHYFQRVAVRGDSRESAALLDRLLNHETSFFRHTPSFEVLGQHLIPKLAAAAKSASPPVLSFWSAGCSTGEEAYSIAATAMDALGAGPVEFAVAGSDWSEAAVERARLARWSLKAESDIPEPYRERYFRRVRSGDPSVEHAHNGLAAAPHPQRVPPILAPRLRGLRASVEPHPALKARVRFARFNFLDPVSYPAGPFHVIFCQNVLIYFRDRLRVEVMANLASCLAPGGYLVSAPGEVPPRSIPGVKPVWFGPTMVLEKDPGSRAHPAAQQWAKGEVLHAK